MTNVGSWPRAVLVTRLKLFGVCTDVPLNPLGLLHSVRDRHAARATEHAKNVFAGHAKQVKQAASYQPGATDTCAAMNGDRLALKDRGVQLIEQDGQLAC